jgi:hypothetical protein
MGIANYSFGIDTSILADKETCGRFKPALFNLTQDSKNSQKKTRVMGIKFQENKRLVGRQWVRKVG